MTSADGILDNIAVSDRAERPTAPRNVAKRNTVFTVLSLLIVSAVISIISLPFLYNHIWWQIFDFSLAANTEQAKRIGTLMTDEIARTGDPQLALERFQYMLENSPQDRTQFVCIVKGNGTVIAHPKPGDVGKDITAYTLNFVDPRTQAERVVGYDYSAIESLDINGYITRPDGSQDIIAQAYIPGLPWTVCVHTSFDKITAEADSLFKSTLSLLAPSMLLLVILGTVTVRMFSQRYELQLENFNAALMRENERADRASAAKSEFLSRLSHEVRSPLHAVMLNAEILRDHKPKPEQAERHIEHIQKNSENILALLNDILDLSKVEAGKIDFHLEDIDMESFLGQLSENLSALIEENGNILKIDTTFANHERIVNDPLRLTQILTNLIVNASKFTKNGRITLKVCDNPPTRALNGYKDGERLCLRVIDTGVGMSACELDDIFDEFTQIAANKKAAANGTGLGLAIAKKLAVLMGGDISVNSTLGEGTEFIVDIPAIVAPRV